jgi:hypothetical protein
VEELRVNLLVKAAKVHAKAAAKKSIESAAEDLSIAVSERICEPAEILEVYGPDDRVTFLDASELWTFATEGEWWSVGSKERDHGRALARLVFMVERALAQNLISLQELADALTFARSPASPVPALQDVVRHALISEERRDGARPRRACFASFRWRSCSAFLLAEVWKSRGGRVIREAERAHSHRARARADVTWRQGGKPKPARDAPIRPPRRQARVGSEACGAGEGPPEQLAQPDLDQRPAGASRPPTPAKHRCRCRRGARRGRVRTATPRPSAARGARRG